MFDPLGGLRVLNQHRVRYVIVGGYAAGILGAPIMTVDLDICYERTADNHERLAAALVELQATLRVPGVDADLPFLLDARTLAAGDSFTFTTSVGDLDILGTPSGTNGFKDLEAAAQTYDLGDGLLVRVCSLDDLIRMKEAASRPKDEVHLHQLTVLRDEIRRAESSGSN